jgi:O-antigen/teichoic acid export membrane protein
MSFFGPISTPALEEAYMPLIRRAFYHARVVGNFAAVQAAVQLIGFLSGILLVRWLPERQYAYFTIANSMQSTINILADIGIGVGLISIGGRVWQDRHRFGELIKTGLSVRRKLGAAAIIIVTPIMCFMLLRNGASVSYTSLLSVAVIVGLLFQFSVGVLNVVPRLRSDVGRIQIIDFTAASVRLLLVAGFIFVFATAGVAVTIATAVFFLQYLMLHRYVTRVVDLNVSENSEDRREIVRLTKHLAANSVFYCLQGQITVFLISLFAHRVSAIAEIGALGRLAMIFTILSNLLTNVFVPAFARCQSRRKLAWLYFLIVSGVVAFSAVIFAFAVFFPDQFLFVLGTKYAHLHRELLLIVGLTIISSLTGTFWSLNASKAWVSGAWLYIPLTLVSQVALIPFFDFSKVSDVLTFTLLSNAPNLLLNFAMTYRGFRTFRPAVA